MKLLCRTVLYTNYDCVLPYPFKGDCDEDEDCEKGLFCYRRSEFEMVPGCAGQGSEGTDYCFDPVDLGGDF